MSLAEKLQTLTTPQLMMLHNAKSEYDLNVFFIEIGYQPTPDEREDIVHYIVQRGSRELSDVELAAVSGGANFEMCENKVYETWFPVSLSICLKTNCRYYRKDTQMSYCDFFSASFQRRSGS